jgi:hypothetical protein
MGSARLSLPHRQVCRANIKSSQRALSLFFITLLEALRFQKQRIPWICLSSPKSLKEQVMSSLSPFEAVESYIDGAGPPLLPHLSTDL